MDDICLATVLALALIAIGGCAAVESAAGESYPRAIPPDTRPFERHLLVLENDAVVVGVLPAVGGRVVVLRRFDGANVLKSHPTQWDPATDERPVPSSDGG